MKRIRPRIWLWSGLLLSIAGAALLLLGTAWQSRVLCQWVSMPEGSGARPVWAGEGRRLRPGDSIRCELTGDAAQAHRAFKILSEAGQFLHLTVDQPEIDVSAVLWSPERKAVLEIDTLPGNEERLFYITPEAGEYGLVVSADPGKTGSFRITLESVRRPTEMDRLRAKAAAAFSEGERYRKAEEHECAKESYERALALWTKLGDTEAALETLYQIGFARAELGQHEEVYSLWEQEVLPGWHGTSREPAFLNSLGWHAYSNGKKAEALEFYRRAFEAAHRQGQHSQQMLALRGLIDTHRLRGEIQQGFDTFRTALSLARSKGERAELFGTMGDFFLGMGDPERSLRFYNASLEWPAAPARRVHLLTWKGMAEFQLGDYKPALDTLKDALSLAGPPGIDDPGLAAQVLNNLGTLFAERYDKQKQDPEFLRLAESYFKEAQTLTAQVGDKLSEAIAISYLGRIDDLEGYDERAVESYTRAYEQFSEADFFDGIVGSLHGRARALRDLGHLEDARSDVERAIERVQEERRATPKGAARAAFLSNHLSLWQFQIDLLAELHERSPQAGYDDLAFEKSEAFRAPSLFEEFSEPRLPPDTQPHLLKDIERIEVQLQQLNPLLLLPPEEAIGSPVEALEERTLELMVEWESLRARLDGQTREVSHRPKPVTVQEVQRHLDDDTLILAFMSGEERGYLWSIGREGTELFLLPEWREIEGQAEVVASHMVGSHDPKTDSRWLEAAASLSERLFADVAPLLGRRRLIILRDGPLARIPLDALPDPRRRPRTSTLLMENNQVLYAPSASVLVRILERGRHRPPARKQLAAFGDPVFEPGDSRVIRRPQAPPPDGSTPEGGEPGTRSLGRLERLEASRVEVESITELVPEGQFLKILDFEASRERLRQPDLAGYRILHLATHSLLDRVFPELSSLVFSMVDEAGEPRNGFLTYYEISDLNLPIDMVVLSACETASGKEIQGEGVIGLGRAFLRAGASRVVVSLWDADDKATAFLMEKFYEGIFLHDLPPPEALRRARLAVRSRPQWRAPYYWAPFVLEGDWR